MVSDLLLVSKKHVLLFLYYGFAQYLPSSYFPVVGKIFNAIRILCVKGIFKRCGKISTIDRCAYFGNGANVEIDDYSGIGANCFLPNDIIIGKYVMMASEVYIAKSNHEFGKISTPMCFQGVSESKVTIIEDDCWIGRRVIMTPGRYVRKGSIIAAGAVLTKDFEEYSIVGGNPAKLIRKRII